MQPEVQGSVRSWSLMKVSCQVINVKQSELGGAMWRYSAVAIGGSPRWLWGPCFS